MSSTRFSTKERILGAAEELFAQQGFSGTSLRQVTSRAEVNIAAVNYHFGSKENLVNEVFRRRMDDMSAQRLEMLRKAREEAPDSLEAILAAFVQPALALALLTAGLSAWALATAEAPSVLRSAAVVGVVGLVVVASTALWRALIAVAGPWPGRIVSAAVAAASIGAAWWVWVAGSAPSAVTTATSGSTTGQGTAALDSLLLAGPDPVVWAGAAVLLAVAVFSTLAARVAGPRP